MIDASLIARAQALLNQLQPLSEVPAAQASIGHGHPDGGIPAGLVFNSAGELTRIRSTLETYGSMLDRAELEDSNADYTRAIGWGQRQYNTITRGRSVVPETPAQFRTRIVANYEGVIAPTVAARERCSVFLIREARDRLGRTKRFGHPIGAPTDA